jgi:hypothetical protein
VRKLNTEISIGQPLDFSKMNNILSGMASTLKNRPIQREKRSKLPQKDFTR